MSHTLAVRTLTRTGLITGLGVIVAFPSLPAPWYCLPWEDAVCHGIPPICTCVPHGGPGLTADELTPAPPAVPSKVPGGPVMRDGQ